ncbi:transcription factor bHLH94 [Ricinus communis]|uniref:transcription factor bHLH94 n=1 Tax=Ricinus communis TaxID=3988 RepID=UPI00201A8840|nr:transcription factor bHLH94 [Ricinus communis]
MALEAVIYQQDLFGHPSRELYNLLGGNWSYDHYSLLEREEDKAVYSFDNFLEKQTENSLHGDWGNNSSSSPSMFPHHFNEMLHINPSPDAANVATGLTNSTTTTTTTTTTTATTITSPAASELLPDHQHQLLDSPSIMPAARAKRRRSRSRKNKEEIENQRMTHIAVERNRRKQMNEYLSVLRSLMPESYVQRGDQASIIGGAINFVKELEQRLQLLGGHKEIKGKSDHGEHHASNNPLPFSEFFTFPQYSTTSTRSDNSVAAANETMSSATQSTIADIEVTMVESHANLKIRSKRRPKQLLKVVSGLHTLRLTILHLNVTTTEQIVLYCLSVKVEDDCKLSSVDEIATAVYQMLGRIQQDYSVMN